MRMCCCNSLNVLWRPSGSLQYTVWRIVHGISQLTEGCSTKRFYLHAPRDEQASPAALLNLCSMQNTRK